MHAGPEGLRARAGNCRGGRLGRPGARLGASSTSSTWKKRRSPSFAQGDPTNARRSDLASELGKRGAGDRYAAFLDILPSVIAREARGLTGAPRQRARRGLCPHPRARRHRSPAFARSRGDGLPAWRNPRLGCRPGSLKRQTAAARAGAWATPSTSRPRSATRTGRRISAMPMRRSPPTSSRASSGPRAAMSASRPGTDEHGLKMAQAARAENIEPRELCEQNVASFPRDVRQA